MCQADGVVRDAESAVDQGFACALKPQLDGRGGVRPGEEADAPRAAVGEVGGQPIADLDVVDGDDVVGAAFGRRDDVAVQQDDGDVVCLEEPDDLHRHGRGVGHELDGLEKDACNALRDVVLRKGECAADARSGVGGRGVAEEKRVAGVARGLRDGGADGRGDFAVGDVRDDESEASGHAVGHFAQVRSGSVARLENAILLQPVQREANGRAGDLEAADELLFARELAVCAELAVQDLPPQGREDLGRDASLCRNVHCHMSSIETSLTHSAK